MVRRGTGKDPGFSLIELMVVLAVLGILATLAGPHFRHLVDSIEARVKLSLMSRQISAFLALQQRTSAQILGSDCPSCTHCRVYPRSQPESLRSDRFFSSACRSAMNAALITLGVEYTTLGSGNFWFAYDPNDGETAQYDDKCVPDHLYASSWRSKAVYVYVITPPECDSLEGRGFYTYLTPLNAEPLVPWLPNVTKPKVLHPGSP